MLHQARMCDTQCTVGIGITAGLLGIMMTIICCKTLCEFLLEMNNPDTEQAPTRTNPQKVIEMPIVIRIYLPQQANNATGATAPTAPIVATATVATVATQKGDIQRKNVFEPVPVETIVTREAHD